MTDPFCVAKIYWDMVPFYAHLEPAMTKINVYGADVNREFIQIID